MKNLMSWQANQQRFKGMNKFANNSYQVLKHYLYAND